MLCVFYYAYFLLLETTSEHISIASRPTTKR